MSIRPPALIKRPQLEYDDPEMKQLNSYHLYELGAKLHALFNAEKDGSVADLFAPLSEAQILLDGLIKGDIIPLNGAKADAVKLLNKIAAMFNRAFIDPASKQLEKTKNSEDRIDSHEWATLHSLVEKFEHALAAELNRAPTYVASPCGIYSTFNLAENAQKAFSDSLRAVLPSAAQQEFAASGRALAFGMGTASILHAVGAIEIMLRAYTELFNGGPPAKAERNFASYVKKLSALAEDESNATRPDKRVVQMLAHVKDHYRNPLLADESLQTADEAAQLFGIASALIGLMAEAVRSQQPQPARAPENPRASDPTYDFQIRE